MLVISGFYYCLQLKLTLKLNFSLPVEGPCHKALRKLQATRLGASHGTTGHLVGTFMHTTHFCRAGVKMLL